MTPTPRIRISGRSGHHLVQSTAVEIVATSSTPADFVRRAFSHGLTKPGERRARRLYALVRAELDRRQEDECRRRERVPDSRLEAA